MSKVIVMEIYYLEFLSQFFLFDPIDTCVYVCVLGSSSVHCLKFRHRYC